MADSLSNVTGLSSGIDYRSLVDQIIALDRKPADAMQATVDANAKRKDALSQLRTAYDTLETAAAAFKSGGSASERYVVAATGTDASGRTLLAAVPAAGATPGSYAVTVERLAAAQKTVGTAGVASTGALGVAGTFQVNGKDVTVAATDTVANVRDKINALSATTGVRASVVVGSATDARLVLSSASTGAAHAFTVADTDGTLAGTTFGLTGAPNQPAQDARVVVDGVPAERPTNTVADVVPGATLTLTAADPARTATVEVTRDGQASASALQAFVDAFNTVRALTKKLTAVGGDLAGDQMSRSSATSLASTVLKADTALGAGMQTLASAGVSIQRDGTLAIDSAKYQAAAGSPDALGALLASRLGAIADQAKTVAEPMLGLADQRASAIDDQSQRLTDRIAEVDARLDKKKTSLLAMYAKFESSLGALKAAGDSLTAQLKGLTASSSSS